MALQIGTSGFRKVIREILENEKLPELKDLATQQFIFINVNMNQIHCANRQSLIFTKLPFIQLS